MREKLKLNNKTVGIICVVLGSIFFIAGLVLFIMSNAVNLYAQKTDASIVSRYEVTSDEGSRTILELAFRVGDEMVYTTYTVFEEIDEDEPNYEIYYNVKNPKEILEAGWQLESIIPAAFGILILMTGLYSLGVISLGFELNRKPGSRASEWDKKYYEAKERVENDFIPLLGVVSFIVFGVFLLVNKTGWWAWLFVVAGSLGAFYFLIDLIPALAELITMNRIKKYKGRSLSVDSDFEEFEKNIDNKGKEEDTLKKNPDGFEIEDTIEIKSLDVKKKRKK
ncbi:MAG: hypothetical protein K6G75_05460 [Lachnospiraceae bacterium]|nr:hypothetical protein [Lachnospiraceae bacterium]